MDAKHLAEEQRLKQHGVEADQRNQSEESDRQLLNEYKASVEQKSSKDEKKRRKQADALFKKSVSLNPDLRLETKTTLDVPKPPKIKDTKSAPSFRYKINDYRNTHCRITKHLTDPVKNEIFNLFRSWNSPKFVDQQYIDNGVARNIFHRTNSYGRLGVWNASGTEISFDLHGLFLHEAPIILNLLIFPLLKKGGLKRKIFLIPGKGDGNSDGKGLLYLAL
jgi:hypothetical protein